MRGIELPINALILIILAVIVLIAIIAFFYPEFLGQSKTVSLESAKNAACMELLDLECKVSPTRIFTPHFDSDGDGVVGDVGTTKVMCGLSNGVRGDNLYNLCHCWLGLPLNVPEQDCKKLCGCP